MTTSATRSSATTFLRAAAPVALIAFTATILRLFPPAQSTFYPRCPINVLFHIQCPGCGATRALAALLQGHLTEALHFNALIVIALPFLIIWAALTYYRFLQRIPIRSPKLSPAAIYATLTLVTLFTIARNL